MARAQPVFRIAGGDFHKGEDPDLREGTGLVEEAVLDPHFRIAKAPLGGQTLGPIVGIGHDEVELGIREDAVVEFHGRAESGAHAWNPLPRREQVQLQVTQVHRLRIVGEKGGTRRQPCAQG